MLTMILQSHICIFVFVFVLIEFKYTPLNSMTMSRINFEDEVVIFHVLLLLASLSYIFFSHNFLTQNFFSEK